MPALSLGDLTACCSKEIIHRAGLLCQVFISEQSLLSSCSGSHLLRLMESFPHPKALRPPRLLAASSSELNNHAPSERPQIHGGETPFSFPSAAAQGPFARSICMHRACTQRAGCWSRLPARCPWDARSPPSFAKGSLLLPFISRQLGGVEVCRDTQAPGGFWRGPEREGGPVACRCKEASMQSHRVKARGVVASLLCEQFTYTYVFKWRGA